MDWYLVGASLFLAAMIILVTFLLIFTPTKEMTAVTAAATEQLRPG